MPGAGARDYYIITSRGERGPVDRAGLRELLAGDEIDGEDQVRNAFGRPMGTVAQVLANPSDRHGSPGRVHPPPQRTHPEAPRPRAIPLGGVVAALLLVMAGAIWFATRNSEEPLPPPEPAATPAVPAPASAVPVSPPAAPIPELAAAPTLDAITACDSGQRTAQLAADGDLSTAWRCPLASRDAAHRLAWLQYRSGPRLVAAYALASAGTQPEADPRSWRLVGVQSDGREQVLDARSDETFPERFQRRIFPIGQPGAYASYRLEVLEVRKQPPADALQIAEFALLDAVPAASSELPTGWLTDSIGAEGSPPPLYDGLVWTVRGAGIDIWDRADQCRFVYQPIAGDATLTALLLASDGLASCAKPALMIRASTARDAPCVMLSVAPDGAVEFNHRPLAGGLTTASNPFRASLPVWLRLTRRGAQVTGALSINGVQWKSAPTVSFPALNGTLLAGLAVCSKQPGKPMTTRFTRVGITVP